MNSPLPLAFSFPTWSCKGCGERVQWADAIAVMYEDGKPAGFRHVWCEVPDDD